MSALEGRYRPPCFSTGRQAKMAFVNSVAKPPRDVRRRQEKFGTGGAAVPEKIKYAPYSSVVSALGEESPGACRSPRGRKQFILGVKAQSGSMGSRGRPDQCGNDLPEPQLP